MGFVSDLLTGGGSSGYSSGKNSEYESALRSGIYNRLGATRKKTGTDANGNPIYSYDTSNIGQNITPSQATENYTGFNYLKNAMDKTGTSTYSPESYKKTVYNYQSTPDTYYSNAIASGSKDINRAGQSNLTQLQETVGTRRPGLLLKGAEQSNRDVGEQLASLTTNLRGEQAKEKTSLAKEQQQNQAAENLNAAKFGESQKQFASEEARDRAKSYADIASNYLTGELGATEAERNYQDKALEYLQNLFSTTTGSTNQAASTSASKYGSMLNFLGKLI